MKYIYAIVSVVIFILMLLTNYASTSNIVPWLNMNGLENIFPFAYMPPGFAFGVSWGLIYLLLSIYLISLLYRIIYDYTKSTQREIYIFGLINILNITWLISTSYKQYILAGIIIFFLFLTLVYFLQKFGRGIYKNVAFGIYLGWITIASFGLTLSQFVFLAIGEVALSYAYGNFILIFALFITLITYKKVKNPYALFWSISAIIITMIKFYGIAFT